MASLSQDLEDPGLMKVARACYTTGLSLTNAALEDNIIALQESTLVAVLLLSLFEAILWERPHTPNNWTAHTHGALVLVRLRGQQQFETDLGRRLFYQVTNNIRVSCIQQRRHLPPVFASLVSSAKPFYEDDNPKIALAALLGELAELLADIHEARMCPFEITKAAMQLERKYSLLVRQLPPAWQYTETYVEGQANVYGATIHQYPNHRAAQLWNSYRMIRILLKEIVYACTGSAASPVATNMVENPSKNSLHLQASSNIAEMSYDICASIPHLTRPSPSSTMWKACVTSLLWPLSAIKGASLAPESARRYAVARLRYLGDELKLPQAVRIANETRDELKE
ncbi:hypothetical protein BCR34DRAFT_595207 [Clohesyomyces aquaticus]|uniref:Fungal-specific transcription factor domain-domain-containing protein n=1 Tax=Clohesyomyces aquaticus TaxID=1231657 RepID=A0A1Y2AB89_9PLEO|nr:hypothetical protein BCR34DRAFT_595207 [Clohesyomyces aquaticus]